VFYDFNDVGQLSRRSMIPRLGVVEKFRSWKSRRGRTTGRSCSSRLGNRRTRYSSVIVTLIEETRLRDAIVTKNFAARQIGSSLIY